METTRRTNTGRPAGGRQRALHVRKAKPRGIRWGRVFGISAVILLGMAVVLLGALHIRLSQGPIAVDLLLQPLEASINRSIAPLRMRIGRTVLRYEESGFGLALRLADIRIDDETGAPVATAPFAAIRISSRALLRGTIAPTRIDLLQPKLLLTVDRQNRLSLRSAKAAAPSVTTPGDLAIPTIAAQGTTSPLAVDTLLGAVLAEALQGGGLSRTSELTAFGLRDAFLVLDYHGRRSIWGLPVFSLRRADANGDRRLIARGSLVSGSGTAEVDISVAGKQGRHVVTLAVRDLFPADFGVAITELGPMSGVSLPVSATARFVLDSDGRIEAGEAELSAAPAAISTLSPCASPFIFDSGTLRLRYARADGAIEILPSQLASNLGRTSLAGRLQRDGADGPWRWAFDLSGVELGTGDAGFKRLAVPAAQLRGAYDPATSLFSLERLHLPFGDGAIDVAGRTTPTAGTVFEAFITNVDSAVFKRIWPSCVAEDARAWIRENIRAATISQATARIAMPVTAGSGPVLQVAGTASAVAFTSLPGLPPITAPQARFELAGGRYQITAPVSTLALAPERALTVRNGAFTIPDIDAPDVEGVFTGEVASSVGTALQFLASPAVSAFRDGELVPPLDGEQVGTWSIRFPLRAQIERDQVRLSGKAKISNLRYAESETGERPMLAVNGGALDLDISGGMMRITGDVLLNGVDFRVTGTRALGPAGAADSRVSFTATLDETDRDQLGISVNHMVRGDVTMTAEVPPPSAGAPTPAKVTADLSNAELVLDTVAWQKPAGSPAALSVTVTPQDDGTIHLDEFRLTGDAVGIGGRLVLDRQRRLQSFDFPDFSIDVVTRLKLAGKRRPDNVIDITARGETFDGRKLFRALFSAGRVTDKDLPVSRDTEGIDLTAEIGTMIGYNEVSLRQVIARLSRRRGKLTEMTASGTLDGGSAVATQVQAAKDGSRLLIAETRDAGLAFKLVDLYSNVEGGEASLRVDLDGPSRTEKTGTLWARRFVVLGDPIVEEVLKSYDSSDTVQSAPQGRRRKGPTQRERLEFDNMRVPFRVGSGRLTLGDTIINGPILGATLRGTIDFAQRDVRLAGTYVPLFGLNAMFSGVPILGDLLSGRSGEGVFGITFAINGPIERPQVLVNPISMVAPGIFRQIFEFDPAMKIPTNDPPKSRRKAKQPVTPGLSSEPPTSGSTVTPQIGEAMPAATAPPKKPTAKKKPAAEMLTP